MKSAWLALTSVIRAAMRLAMLCSSPSPNALSSVAMTAQLGLARHAASCTVVVKADMLIGTCASRRNAASASLVSAAKAILDFSGFTKPKPSGLRVDDELGGGGEALVQDEDAVLRP